MVVQVLVTDTKGARKTTANKSDSQLDSTKRSGQDVHTKSSGTATCGLDALAASAALEERMESAAPATVNDEVDDNHSRSVSPQLGNYNINESVPLKAHKMNSNGVGSGGIRRALPFSENQTIHHHRPTTTTSHPNRPYHHQQHHHYDWRLHSPYGDGIVAGSTASAGNLDEMQRQNPTIPSAAGAASPSSASSYSVSRRPPVAHPMHILPTAAELKIGGCTCKKSRCLKLYCQCFASSTTCGANCKCITCHNTTLHAEAIERARLAILQRNPAAFDKGQQHALNLMVNSKNNSSNGNLSTSNTPAMMQQDHHSPWSHTMGSSTTTSLASATPWTSRLYSPGRYHSSSSNNNGAVPTTTTPTTTPMPQDSLIPAHRIGKRYGCKCKRSFCLKKYCECFQNAAHCDLTCRCTNCKNVAPKKSESSLLLTTTAATSKTTTNRNNSNSSASITVVEASSSTSPTTPSSPSQPQHEPEQDEESLENEQDIRDCEDQIQHNNNNNKDVVREDDDHMAMLAAVAMTELVRREASNSSLTTSPPSTQTTTIIDIKPITPEESKPVRLVEIQENTPPVAQESHSAIHDRFLKKRRLEHDSEERRVPIKKRKPPTPTLDDDEEVKAVVSSTCNLSIESRNPSPISSLRSPSYYPAPARFPYDTMGPQQHVYMPHMYGHPAAAAPGGGMSRSPPPPYHHHPRPSPPPYHPPHHHHLHYPYPMNTHHRGSPLTIYPPAIPPPPPTATPRGSPHAAMRSSPIVQHRQQSSPSSLPPYEELMRTSGLPKSLSFRKICSKCGKTRGEHGDLGFGNKCVYQECGKCGAGQHVHEKAGQPMGISCSLTVAQGARPGAAAEYNRRIRELAARADLQRELNSMNNNNKNSGSLSNSYATSTPTTTTTSTNQQ